MDEQADQSLTTVIGAAGGELRSLLSLDAQLLQAEMKAKASDALSTGVWSLAAFALLVLGGLVAVQTLVFFLIWLGMPPVLAALAVAAALIVLGLLCLLMARSFIKGLSFLPERTIASVREDLATLKKAVANVAS